MHAPNQEAKTGSWYVEKVFALARRLRQAVFSVIRPEARQSGESLKLRGCGLGARSFVPFQGKAGGVRWILLACLLVPPLYFSIILEPQSYGDGPEYFIQLWALSSHLSPDIRLSDVESLSNYLGEYTVPHFHVSLLQAWKEQIESGNEISTYLLFGAPSGSYYGLHFWFYAAVCVPAKWALHILQGNELKAFQLTNALLLGIGLAYLLFVRSLGLELRIAAALLLYGVGTPYYLRWPHPEIFSTVACLIASIAFLERRLTLATVACALGALQNPSMALMIPVIFASHLDQWLKLPLSGKGKLLGKLFMAGSLSFLPVAFFLITFGTPSLIMREGYLKQDHIDFDRLYSLFFDLNQGMVVGAGWIMALSSLILLSRFFSLFKSPRHHRMARCLRREDWLLVGMLLMAIGVLPQGNWNSGQEVYIRYAIWLCIPLMLWTVHHVSDVKLGQFCLVLVIAAQLLTVYSFGAFSRTGEESNFLWHKRIAVAVLRYAPWAYNPEPEIFVERTLSREVSKSSLKWPKVVVFIPYNRGRVMKKILVHKTKVHTLSEEICGSSHELMTEQGDRIQPNMYRNTRYDFLYLSGSLLCFPQPIVKHTD